MAAKKQGMEVFILLDRTGSMASLWDEAVTSVNAYIHELKMEGAPDRLTLAAFDFYEGTMRFDILRDSDPIKTCADLGAEEVMPRGGTPLLDALGKIITMAEEKGEAKTAIVVMTDGFENASREWSLASARAAVERVEKKGWQVSFLGVAFDGFAQARAVGVPRGRSMNVARGRSSSAMEATADMHRRYRNTGLAQEYTDRNRSESGEDEVE